VRRIRICVPTDLSGASITPSKSTLHYLRKVLRLDDGDSLNVFDGNNHERQATLAGVTLELHDAVAPLPPSALRISLIQGIARGDRMDTIVQKATELGVHRIVPIFTERCEVKLVGERRAKRLGHWHQIALSACEQCGRAELPIIVEPCDLSTAIASLPMRASQTLSVVLAPDGSQPLCALESVPRQLHLAVGPEGGFDKAEMEQMIDGGFLAAKLGPRVLRTETAGPAALAVAQAHWGDLAHVVDETPS